AVLEAEVRGDRDREQDPEDDDDDEELDQREAALLACDTVPQVANHASLLTGNGGRGDCVALRPVSPAARPALEPRTSDVDNGSPSLKGSLGGADEPRGESCRLPIRSTTCSSRWSRATRPTCT